MTTRHGSPSRLVVLCALPPEAIAVWVGLRAYARRSSDRAGPALRDRAAATRVRLVGMGPQRARKASAALASTLPDGVPVVVIGVGGALGKGYEAGDLVVASALGTADAGEDGQLRVTRPPVGLDERSQALATQLFEALSGEWPSTTWAPVLSASRTARGPERAVLAGSGAVICDTESVWLARLASRRPFAVVRSIVDTPERELLSLQTVTGGVRGLHRLVAATTVIAETLLG